MTSLAEARTRSDSHHGARVVRSGVAFELLCERGVAFPTLRSEIEDRPAASVLCSITRGLDRAPTASRLRWDGERATVESPGAVATVRYLGPRRYAVTARVESDAHLAPLLDAVAGAVKSREAKYVTR
jgi:hypothetical protein